MNVILATGDKSVDRIVARIPNVTILTTVAKSDQVVDRVIGLNPHILILSERLKGAVGVREIVARLRAAQPSVRIIVLLDRESPDRKLLMDFLIRNGVYDILFDGWYPEELQNVLLEPTSFSQMKSYLLDDSPLSPNPPFLEEKNEDPPPPTVVEKIVEKETVRYVGNITIGVAGLLPRSGATHAALMIGSFLRHRKKDVGLVVQPEVLQALRDYYQLTDPETVIFGLSVYDNPMAASSSHRIVVSDCGVVSSAPKQFFQCNFKLLLCPSAPWEIDRLTDFLRDNEAMARYVEYLFYPIDAERFGDLRKNLKQGGCRSWRVQSAPDFTDKINHPILQDILKNIL